MRGLGKQTVKRLRKQIEERRTSMQKFTVIGVIVNDPCYGERFADHVEAESWRSAEERVREKRGDRIMIAGVLAGEHSCVDGEE